MVANIPYNITSPIIFKLLESSNINSATLMVQKRFVIELLLNQEQKTITALTVIINYYMEVTKVMNVSKKLFRPIPKVDSAVFKMSRREKELNDDEENYLLKL